jgi:hypothetical protein
VPDGSRQRGFAALPRPMDESNRRIAQGLDQAGLDKTGMMFGGLHVG